MTRAGAWEIALAGAAAMRRPSAVTYTLALGALARGARPWRAALALLEDMRHRGVSRTAKRDTSDHVQECIILCAP